MHVRRHACIDGRYDRVSWRQCWTRHARGHCVRDQHHENVYQVAAHFTVAPRLAGQMLDADGERITVYIVLAFVAVVAILAVVGVVTVVQLLS